MPQTLASANNANARSPPLRTLSSATARDAACARCQSDEHLGLTVAQTELGTSMSAEEVGAGEAESCEKARREMERICTSLGIADCAELIRAHHVSAAAVVVASLLVGLLTVFVYASWDHGGQQRGTAIPVVPGVPLFGNLFQLGSIESVHETLIEWSERYGAEAGAYEFRVLGKRFVVLCSEDTILEVFRHRPFDVVRSEKVKEVVALIAPGVFSSDGERWRVERRAIGHAFGFGRLDKSIAGIQRAACRLAQLWRREIAASHRAGKIAAVEIAEDLHRYTMDNVAHVGFRLDLDSINRSQHSTQLVDDIRTIFKVSNQRLIGNVPYYRLPFRLGERWDGGLPPTRRIYEQMDKIVSELEQRGAQAGEADSSVLASLIRDNAEARAAGEPTLLSRKQLIGNILELFLAGTDTTAHTLSWMLYQLALDPNLQRAAASEADAFHQRHTRGEALGSADIMQALVITRCVFHEVMRMYGPGGMIQLEHVDGTNLTVAGERIEPRSRVFFAMINYVTQRETLVPDDGGPNGELRADRFAPQRWLNDNKDGLTSAIPRSYFAFGHGARICPGKDLAQLEAIMCVAEVLHNFQISLEANHPPVKPVFRFTVQPDTPVRLYLKIRDAVA
mmetsp:Transcript_8090/g.21409  ORF Transcript_8090/g.21409 Transcript_8090/m.21409 type:complete len:622 (+) Transcript_8090:343-2208(+)